MKKSQLDESKLALWQSSLFDEETHREIDRLMRHDRVELESAFSGNLKFGTGGLRAKVGVGPNRINSYNLRKTTLGLLNWLHKNSPAPLRLVIGYDCRAQSAQFALDCAQLLSDHHVETYLFKANRPTPLLSFALRHIKASGGIMITASHNPPEYNGYKVYGPDGGQLCDTLELMQEIEKAPYPPQSSGKGKIEELALSIDQAYLKELTLTYKKMDLANLNLPPISIVYSNLHGTGATLMSQALNSWGFHHIYDVLDQKQSHGDFPTVSSPNPEEKSALEMGMNQLESIQGDLLLATDPDADRIGIAINHRGKIEHVKGQEVAILIAHYLLKQGQYSQNKKKPLLVKSLVTSNLIEKLSAHYQGQCLNVLPGFKYIAKIIESYEGHSEYAFLAGLEESCGYLFTTFTRDKDALSSACLIAQMTAQAKSMNMTLIDQLEKIYEKQGLFRHRLCNYVLVKEPYDIHTLIIKLTHHLKESSFQLINFIDMKTTSYKELRAEIILLKIKKKSYQGEILVRSSGTEPKIKVYLSLSANFEQSSSIQSCDEELLNLKAVIDQAFID